MSEASSTLLPRPVLTPDQVARRQVFATACAVLSIDDAAALRAALFAHGVIADEGAWRRLWRDPLLWMAGHRTATGEAALRFDAFWLLVEEQHAALHAAPAAPSQP